MDRQWIERLADPYIAAYRPPRMLPAPRSAAVRWVLVVLVSAVAIATSAARRRAPARAQPPMPTATATPCAIAETLRGAALRQRVRTCAANGHRKLGPDTVGTRVLTVTEEDPANPANVIDVYFNTSMPKVGTPERPWEMDHVWPKSHGFAGPDDCNIPLADAHHLFVAHPAANGSAGHLDHPFDDCHHDCTPMPADAPPERQNRRGRDAAGGIVFEVWRGRRGDIARALLYVDVRYEGGPTASDRPSAGGACHDEPQLELVEDVPPGGGAPAPGIPRYGRLSTLVRWALQDPVDDRERYRNG